MNKKLAVLLSLALVLVAFCAVASAATELELYAPNGQGLATPDYVVNKTIDAESKAKVNVWPARGATVKIWYWYDGSGGFNMSTGNQVNQVRYTVRGNRFNAKVVSGTNWISLYKKDGFGNFGWKIKNLTAKSIDTVRVGKIRLTDNYGTICNIELRQCPDVEIKSVSQLKGWKHDGKVRIQATRAYNSHGNMLYNCKTYAELGYEDIDEDGEVVRYLSYEDEQYLMNMLTVKRHMKETIWYQTNREVGTWQYYNIRPYRVMGGVKLQGPWDDAFWTVKVTH